MHSIKIYIEHVSAEHMSFAYTRMEDTPENHRYITITIQCHY